MKKRFVLLGLGIFVILLVIVMSPQEPTPEIDIAQLYPEPLVDRNDYNDDSKADEIIKNEFTQEENSYIDKFCNDNGYDYGVKSNDVSVVCVTEEHDSDYNTYIRVNKTNNG